MIQLPAIIIFLGNVASFLLGYFVCLLVWGASIRSATASSSSSNGGSGGCYTVDRAGNAVEE